MSGHSKFHNIKAKKEKADSKRAGIFTKLGRELAIAVKSGGPDPAGNSRLKDVIAKCKAANMPNDNIKRSIEKAAGSAEADNYTEITYEGYGPGGIAVMVETTTDNKNRTAADVRHYFDKFGGNLGNPNCVSYMFEKKGVLMVERTDEIDEDELMMLSLDAGAEDFNSEDEYFEIDTAPEDFSKVYDELEGAGYTFLESEIQWVPSNETKLDDEDQRVKMERLIDALEDNDDVTNVWHNWDQDDE